MISKMVLGKWNAVSFEIMHIIFEYIKVDPDHNVLLFMEYQLVCKSWNKAAQEVLYNAVCLNKENPQNFVRTVDERNFFLGSLVKKITFGDGFASLANTDLILDTIIHRCPKITEIYTVNEDVQKIVWAYLASGRSQLKHLQAFIKHDLQTGSLFPLYTSVALRYKETITHLHVSINDPESALPNRKECNLSSEQLPFFQSLKHLRVLRFDSNRLDDLDSMIDACCETVSNLEFDSLDWPLSPVFMQKFKRNTHIKHLSIDHASLPGASLQYLSSKISSLESLHLAIEFGFSMPDQKLTWWDQFVNLCSPLEKYSICIDLNELERAVHLLRQAKSIDCKTLTILANAPQDIYFEHKLKLTKDRDTLELLLSLSNVEELKHDRVHTPLSLYSPNRINIIAENMDGFYNDNTIIIPRFSTDTSKYFPPEAAIYTVRVSLAKKCNQRNWCSFNAATRLIDQTRDSYLHLDRMVFCANPPPEFRPNLSITELRLTNSIIHPKLFPDLSERLPVINKLIIDTCSILMEKQYNLNIFLPYTTLNIFHLKIAPFMNATDCEHGPSQTSIFENEDLLSAANGDGRLIFKIQTDAGLHAIISKRGDTISLISIVKYQQIMHGRDSVFLIRIKCKDMNEFVFENKDKTYVIWEKARPTSI